MPELLHAGRMNDILMDANSTRTDRPDTADAAPDRRRPGRAAYTNRFLIGLLREQPTPPPAEDTQDGQEFSHVSVRPAGDTHHDLAPAVGILVSVVLSVLLWAIILLIVWQF